MNLRFPESQIIEIAKRYNDPLDDKVMSFKETIQTKGYIDKDQLKLVAKWKAPRSAGRIENNTDSYIKEITSFAFSAKDERSRIEILTILSGVAWPTASVLLHLYHKDKYPILDFRALWSANSLIQNQYNFGFWEEFISFCREIAVRNQTSMRTLDRAMWQYSKENQKA
ncbi:MAG: hypothetical protein IIA77_01435 [Proteobacteria bacterium]|nr:hypothetical protein [Pseudomonadota bacterium]